MNQCPNCGIPLSDNDIIIWKCQKCGKEHRIKFYKIREIYKTKNKTGNSEKTVLKCRECGIGMDNGNEKLSFKCKECGEIIKGNLKYFVSDNVDIKYRWNEEHEKNEVITVNTGSIIVCPECGETINNIVDICPKCGYPIKKSNRRINKDSIEEIPSTNNTLIVKRLKVIRRVAILFSIICFIVSSYYFIKADDVKNSYYNLEYSSISKNAYVGGDAYNFIINGTYFTGYSVIGSAMLISGVIFISNSVHVTVKIKEYT